MVHLATSPPVKASCKPQNFTTSPTMSLLLAKYGVRSRLLERREGLASVPRAHAVNGKTLEIGKSVGLDPVRVHAAALPPAIGGMVRFWSTLGGTYFGGLPYERQDHEVLEIASQKLANISQPRFEALLLELVQGNPLITFERGVQVRSLEACEEEVRLTVEDRRVSDFLVWMAVVMSS